MQGISGDLKEDWIMAHSRQHPQREQQHNDMEHTILSVEDGNEERERERERVMLVVH